jgi:hypothetical protein
MNEELEGYYRDSNGILKQKVAEEAQVAVSPSPLSTEVLDRLEGCSRDELIALVRRFAGQCGMVAMMSKEETAQAMRDKLAEIALKPLVPGANMKADISSCISAIDKWLDRAEGKPVGAATNINIGGGTGDRQIRVVFVNAEDLRKEREMKVIDVTPRE